MSHPAVTISVVSAVLGAILAPLVALIPGFVLVAVYRRYRHVPETPDARFVALALVASLFPHLALLEWTVPILRRLRTSIEAVSALEIAAWVLTLDIVVPVVMGLVLSWVVERGPVERALAWVGWSVVARTRTAWEWVFAPAGPSWVLLTLSDGSLVGGEFGVDSFASLDFDRRDLFIARPYRIKEDRTFGEPLPDALGLWVSGSDIVAVEFYEGVRGGQAADDEPEARS